MKWMLAVLLLVSAVACPSLYGQDKTTDKTKIQGTWTPTEAFFDGVQAPAEVLKDRAWVFSDDQLSEIVKGRRESKATFCLDSSKKPGTFDLGYSEGPAKGQVGTGIYKLDGDVLWICMVVPGERPTDFAAPAGTGRALLVFKRAK